MLQTVTFRDRLITGGVLDREGLHHEFAYGTHGRKLDFGIITPDHPLYDDWVGECVSALRERPRLPAAVLGIANGTNQLAEAIADELGVTALITHKVSPRAVAVTDESMLELAVLDPLAGVTAIEDVGTTGGTTLSGIESVRASGLQRVDALVTWQRTETLTALAAAGIASRSIIYEPLPTYEPDQCAAIGYCALGWDLIPHD